MSERRLRSEARPQALTKYDIALFIEENGKTRWSDLLKEFVENHFNSTFNQNWHLETSYKDKRTEFGFRIPEGTRIRTFMIRLPIPKALTDGEVINVEFTQW